MQPQRPSILTASRWWLIALSIALVALAAILLARRGDSAARQTSARLLEVRRIAHEALARQLNEHTPSVAALTTQPAGGALALDLRLPDAVITARPLGVDAGGDPWVQITVSLLDASGRVISEQGERVAFYRPDARWTVSRILIDGYED